MSDKSFGHSSPPKSTTSKNSDSSAPSNHASSKDSNCFHASQHTAPTANISPAAANLNPSRDSSNPFLSLSKNELLGFAPIKQVLAMNAQKEGTNPVQNKHWKKHA
ncbi:hypothetical protein NX059_005741 [Plenodomus lindquistii]|nr:hypothetical protein NX059_005741 [Plenodomus lindquistii]